MIKESYRVLKDNRVLSILPFHFSNYRNKGGNKKILNNCNLIDGTGSEIKRNVHIGVKNKKIVFIENKITNKDFRLNI